MTSFNCMTSRRRECKLHCSRDCITSWIRQNPLMIASLLAVIFGIIFGLALRLLEPSDDVIAWIAIWGELFLRMLKMIILPLIVCCLVVGVASMEGTSSGKLGALTLTYIFTTQLVACVIGAVLVATIRPGAGFSDSPPEGATVTSVSYADVFMDLLRNMLPENIVQACLQSAYTDVTEVKNVTANMTETVELTKKLMYRDRMNIIGVVTFSLALGLAISRAGEAGRPLYRFFSSLNSVIIIIMDAILWYSPLGIFSLITSALLKINNLSRSLHALGLFVGTCVAGSMLHQVIVLPLLYLLICRKNPLTYFVGILDGVVAGIAPPSSAVAMPYLLRDCPEKFHIDQRIAQFFIPIAVTLNRDGSALFIHVAVMFVAQTYSIPVSVGQQIVLVLLITMLVAAVAVVPSASIVVVLMVSGAVGIPVEGQIGLLMSVEWITDRIRAGTNITSHGFGCAIIDSICRRHLNMFTNPPEEQKLPETNHHVMIDELTKMNLEEVRESML